MDNDVLLHHINGIVDNLVYISQIKAPFVEFIWPGAELADGLNINSLRVHLDIPEGDPIAVVDANYFLLAMPDTSDSRWTPYQEKFQQLYDLLTRNLTEVTVYLVGVERIEAYIVGKSAAGDYVGVSTRLVKR